MDKFFYHKVGSMALIYVLIVWSLIARIAEAQEKTFAWSVPVERVDGSPLLPGDITGYDLRYGSKPPAMAWKFIEFTAETKRVIDIPTVGENCFQARTVESKDLKSAWSKEVCTIVKSDALSKPPVMTVK